jgi:tungstate transport system permease protein
LRGARGEVRQPFAPRPSPLAPRNSQFARSESHIAPFINGFTEAMRLVFSGDPELADIVGLSLRVSGIALLISTVIGVPLGALLGLNRFRGKQGVVAVVYTGMAFPPVVIGLFVYLLLSRSGPLGGLNWPWLPALYTPGAMILAQVIIALPLVAGFTMAAVASVDPALRVQVRALGASPWQTAWAILDETRVGVIAAVVAGFGGIISEVGAVMIVGGNIEGRTRVLTTAIVLETNKGNFALAMALGIVLLSIAFLTNFVILRLQGRHLEP